MLGLKLQRNSSSVAGDAVVPHALHAARNERGATLFEATIVLPLFLIILVCSFDLLRITYSYLTVQYVGREVLRRVMVGTEPVNTARASIVAQAKKFGVTLRASDIVLCPMQTYPGCGVAISTQPTLHVMRIKLPVRYFFFGHVMSEETRKGVTIDTVLVSRKEPR